MLGIRKEKEAYMEEKINNKIIKYKETIFLKIKMKLNNFFNKKEIEDKEENVNQNKGKRESKIFKTKMEVTLTENKKLTMERLKIAIEEGTLDINDLSTNEIGDLADYYETLTKKLANENED